MKVQISLILSLCLGCISAGEDPILASPAGDGQGPQIVFDPLAQPIPNIPFPNNIALTSNANSASGASWNVSVIKPTKHEQHLREMLNKLEGFGPNAPVTVSFDGPLDLSTVTRDSVKIVNIEAGHPREGEIVPLDLGHGYFPREGQTHAYYGHDPFGTSDSLLFPETNIADMDGDGTLESVGHYEVATNTLIIRPIIPLAQGAEHAVLLTRDIFGRSSDGTMGPISSPFDYKAHYAQMPFVQRGLDLADMSEADLAFGWTYTTADILGPLQTMREGLYGRGPLARMATVVDTGISEIRNTSILHDADGVSFPLDPRDHPYILQAEFFTSILSILGNVQNDDNYKLEFNYVDYLVFGSWKTPNVRMSERRDLSVNTHTGEGEVGVEDVPFMLAVPKITARHRPPFPIMLYFHGTGTSRFEPIAVADAMARQGIAVMAFDQVGHGPLIQDLPRLLEENPDIAALLPALLPVIANLLVPDRVEEFYGLEIIEALDKLKAVGLFAELAVHGRAEDYNQDGRFDIAESFFHSDPFRLCASFWQDLVDMMQMVKIVRSLRQDAVPSDPLENPAEATYEELKPYLFSGDFNADGILDVGGPNVALSLAGTSLGGIHSVMGAAIEPEIKTVTPIVAGAGLADIMTRSGLHFILGPLFTDVFGNLIVGCVNEGTLYLSQGDDANRCRDATVGAFASTDVLAEGTEVVLENLNNGLKSTTIINGDGGFATAVDSDIGDSLRLTLSPEDGETQTFETEAKFEGAGYRRNSSEFRQAVGIQQHAFDLCDPANFARHLFIDPLPGHTTKNVLFMNAIGDDTVPVATSIQLGLAAGVFGRDQSDWEPLVKRLIDRGILLNSLYDVHDLLGDNPEDEPAIGLFEPIETDTGVSSMRLADVNGKHEWIAGYDRNGFAFGRYSQNQVAVFHACEGRVILDHPAQCLQAEDCEIMDKLEDIEGCNPVGLSE